MQLDVGGHPLHTRALSVALGQRADGRLDGRGVLLDLRKRGLVPVGGDLQGPGVIHHMVLDAVVDPATATLVAITAAQPAVAFEPSPLTAGESCRDPIDRIRALAGTRLDQEFAHGVSAAVGGPRGCSHILALAHLLGSTTAWALRCERERHATAVERRAGERVFRRDVIVDGHEIGAGRLRLAVQLTDIHLAPAPPVARPMDRLASALEIRLLADVDLQRLALLDLQGAERGRTAGTLAATPWRSRADTLTPLARLGLGPGVTGALLAHMGSDAADRPLLDALLMLAPTLVQCMAALPDSWPLAAPGSGSRMGIGGLPDSCYMWRRDGALARAQAAEATGRATARS